MGLEFQRDDAPSTGVDEIRALWQRLAEAEEQLLAVPLDERWSAWTSALADLMQDERLHAELAQAARQHPRVARAGVVALLRGLGGDSALAEFERTGDQVRAQREGLRAATSPRVALVVLSDNVPLLAAQVLFHALAAGRPTLFKRASQLSGSRLAGGRANENGEPSSGADQLATVLPAQIAAGSSVHGSTDGTQELLAALAQSSRALGDGFASVVWPGGAPDYRELEEELARRAAPLIVYGGAGGQLAYRLRRGAGGRGAEETADANRRREAPGPDELVGFGPQHSVAVVSPGFSTTAGAGEERLSRSLEGLALDIALFEQQGCLSPQVVFVADGAEAAEQVGRGLAEAMREVALRLPPTPSTVFDQAQLQQEVLQAQMGGASVDSGPWGTVLVGGDSPSWPRPLPARRSVRVVGMTPSDLAEALRHHVEELQGVAWIGAQDASADSGDSESARQLSALRSWLRERGVRVAPAGQLQETDAHWRNGGIDLAAVFARACPAEREDAE